MDPTVGNSAVPSSGSRIVSASRKNVEEVGRSEPSQLSQVGSVRDSDGGALDPNITPASCDAEGGGGMAACHHQQQSSIGGAIDELENIVAASPHGSK